MTVSFLDKTLTDIDGVYANSVSVSEADSNLKISYLYIPNAYSSAGVFTKHHFASSSVKFTKKCIKNHTLKAVLVTSGNANVATGKDGEKMTQLLAKMTARFLNLSNKEVAIAATGIIGKPLPKDLDQKHAYLFNDIYQKQPILFSEGILTTDKGPKTVFVETKIGKKYVQIAGVTKGCGMIEPNMATTLGFLVTNVKLSKIQLNDCLKKAIDLSYNMVSVDTDTSTSDMVLIFSTGDVAITQNDPNQLNLFQTALNEACIHLAKQLVIDGEGAEKLIECSIVNARSKQEARTLVKQVINSPLVKTAIAGENPNWGRLVMALGKNPLIKVEPSLVSIFYGELCLFEKGQPFKYDLDLVRKELKKDKILLTIDLGLGNASAIGWGCDLNHTYVDINMEYN